MTAPDSQVDVSALTADQLEAGIHNALKAHNVQAVHDFLLLLAVKDPFRAERIHRTLLVSLEIARGVR